MTTHFMMTTERQLDEQVVDRVFKAPWVAGNARQRVLNDAALVDSDRSEIDDTLEDLVEEIATVWRRP